LSDAITAATARYIATEPCDSMIFTAMCASNQPVIRITEAETGDRPDTRGAVGDGVGVRVQHPG
jgi:hypothetical protein